MQWHLLNQYFCHMDCINLNVSVLEEAVSSEQQLVALLVSGTVSSSTMSSESLALCNQIDHREVL